MTPEAEAGKTSATTSPAIIPPATPPKVEAKVEAPTPPLTSQTFRDESQSLVISGWSGGALQIRGKGFGTELGSLSIGGHNINPTRWTDDDIRGVVPKGVKGEVVITPASGNPIQRGVFPFQRKPPTEA